MFQWPLGQGRWALVSSAHLPLLFKKFFCFQTHPFSAGFNLLMISVIQTRHWPLVLGTQVTTHRPVPLNQALGHSRRSCESYYVKYIPKITLWMSEWPGLNFVYPQSLHTSASSCHSGWNITKSANKFHCICFLYLRRKCQKPFYKTISSKHT